MCVSWTLKPLAKTTVGFFSLCVILLLAGHLNSSTNPRSKLDVSHLKGWGWKIEDDISNREAEETPVSASVCVTECFSCYSVGSCHFCGSRFYIIHPNTLSPKSLTLSALILPSFCMRTLRCEDAIPVHGRSQFVPGLIPDTVLSPMTL